MALRWRRVEVSGGFLLLAAFLFYMDTDGLILWAGLACALHEMGHCLAVLACGGRIAALRLTCVGAELLLAGGAPAGRWSRAAVALAGPAVNGGLAFLSARLASRWGEEAWLFAGLNLSLALFNLLPVGPLDGGRSLAALLDRWEWGERLSAALSAVLSLTLMAAGVWLMCLTANPTLLLTGAWLTVNALAAAKKRDFSGNYPCNQAGGMLNYFSLKKGWSSAAAGPKRGRHGKGGKNTYN